MIFRDIIIENEGNFCYLTNNNQGNWNDFQGRSYRKIPEATFQQIDEDGKALGVKECFHFEGIANPVGSELKESDLLDEAGQEKYSVLTHNPQRSFWDRLFRRK
jgi:hypothetical protein